MDEAAGDGARSCVEILVRAPDREIDIPVVQGEGNVADRVREVEPDPAAAPPRGGRDALQVQSLARLKLDPREEDECDLVTLAVEQRLDVVGAQRVLAVAWSDPDQCVVRVETMQLDL